MRRALRSPSLVVIGAAVLGIPPVVVAASGAVAVEAVVVIAYAYLLFCSGVGVILSFDRRAKRRLEQQEVRTRSYIRRKTDIALRNLESLGWLQRLISPRLPLPNTRGDWAVSPDFLQIVLEQVIARRPVTILELGSGVSSLYIGYALEALGSGTLYSVDHDGKYLSDSREAVRRHELERWVRLIHAPLQETKLSGNRWEWYRLDELDIGRVDMLILDGPPAGGRADARYPGVPLLLDRLNEGAVILLDDYARPGERGIVQRWIREYPELRLEKEFDTEQGTALLSKRALVPSGFDRELEIEMLTSRACASGSNGGAG